MGVPKFFRWISERYPNLSVTVENNLIPAFDCLYLDMNGIIHVCSHPDDTNVQFRISEEQIFTNIFKYIDFLFKTVKPKEVFFLAVDGVAPRAKMNQQRARRFKSSKEMKDRDYAAVQNGVVLPAEKRFDSNAITPGTEFMDRLQQALKKFLSEKIAADNLWHGVDVILSGHETPGEGEHKIQEFIRYRRSLPNYNPNTRHCLYGLDADLMLLGLACHEPYFALLREEVTFSPKNKNRRAYIAEESKFFLLHLSLLRNYIDYEFDSLREDLGPDYDLERIIDDWIVLSFLVGNDFIPHLPNLHIHTSALPLLWQTYIKIRPQLSGYINDNGTLNIDNLLTYVNDLTNFDYKHFEELFDDIKCKGEANGTDFDMADMYNNDNNNDVMEKNLIDFDDVNSEEDILDFDEARQNQFLRHKIDYYNTKLGLTYSPEMLKRQANEYFTALQWISYYYFSGVPSWSWFYPQHYAPFVSDLANLSDDIKMNGISFDMGNPFLPFEQLMAVLPSDSSELLPCCLSILMTTKSSPIIDFYPNTFQTDLNGKKRDWEALVLIPFIAEDRLLSSLNNQKSLLSDDEARRNVHGPHTKYRYTQKGLIISDIDPTTFKVARENLIFGLSPNVQIDVICHGFPTFRHVEHTFVLERAFVRIFENHSTFESIVLRVTPPKETSLDTIAKNFLGKLAYVNWPAFILCKVVAIVDGENRITLDVTKRQFVSTPLDELDSKKYSEFVATQPQELYKRRAITIDTGSPILVLETEHSEGHTYEIVSSHKAGCSIRLERRWVPGKLHWHLYQLSMLYDDLDKLDDISEGCSRLSQLCPVDSTVFCLDPHNYGQQGRVLSINNVRGGIVVTLKPLKEPECSVEDLGDPEGEYLTAGAAAEVLGDIDALALSKITGSIFVSLLCDKSRNQGKKDRVSIGLDLKNNKLNLQVPGWVIKTAENGSVKWLYSMKVVDTLRDYRQKFPQVFEFIKRANYEAMSVEDMFDVGGNMKLLEIRYECLRRYLDGLEYRTLEKLSNQHLLLSGGQIGNLERFVDGMDEHGYSVRTEVATEVELNFKDVFRPHHSLAGSKADVSTDYRLLDRVVCCSEGYTVPLGARGTVIGIEPMPQNDNDVRLEVLFDLEFPSAINIRGSRARCYRMPQYTLINTSHGLRRFNCPRRVVKATPEPIAGINDININILDQLFARLSTQDPPSKNVPLSLKKPINVAIAEHCNGVLDTRLPAKMIQPIVMKKRDACNNSSTVTSTGAAVSPPQPAPPQPAAEPEATTVIDATNCPAEYSRLFAMCAECGVKSASVVERHLGTVTHMAFRCDRLAVPEDKVADGGNDALAEGRARYADRVWRCLYASQHPPHDYQHIFVPAQFRDNPFTEVYPSKVGTSTAAHSPTLPVQPSAPHSCKGAALVHSQSMPMRKFIRAPKSNIRFPKLDR